MALNTTLSSLRLKLKAEVGDSLTIGTQLDALYTQLLASKQELLADEFGFAYLQDRWDKNMVIGTRYYDLPIVDTNGASYLIDYARPLKVDVFFNRLYIPATYGIDTKEYNYLNSDLGIGIDPIQRWRWMQKGAGATNQQFEVWPIPQTNYAVRFTGQRKLNPLVSDSDTADVDDLLLVLSVAVELLATRKDQSSQFRLANAQRRLTQVRSSYPERTSERCVFGGKHYSEETDQRLAPMQIVAIAG